MFFSNGGLGFPLERYFWADAVVQDIFKVFMISLKGKNLPVEHSGTVTAVGSVPHIFETILLSSCIFHTFLDRWRNEHDVTSLTDVGILMADQKHK